jgi:hypothetical protein
MIEQAPQAPIDMTFEDALLYCQFCNHNGHTDWRMPTNDEYTWLHSEGYWCWDTSDVGGLDHEASATFHVIPVRTMIEAAPITAIDMTYEEALLYCQFCDHGGHNDWRMPTNDEYARLQLNGNWCWDTSDFGSVAHKVGSTFPVIPVRSV